MTQRAKLAKALKEARGLWNKACAHDNIPVNLPFVVFSKDNPFIPKQRAAMRKVFRLRTQSAGGSL